MWPGLIHEYLKPHDQRLIETHRTLPDELDFIA